MRPRTQRFVKGPFTELAVPLMKTRLYDREAYDATISSLSNKSVSNLPIALKNAQKFTVKLVDQLRSTRAARWLI
jgi:hypothetical protein